MSEVASPGGPGEFGARLRRERLAVGITQEQLAEGSGLSVRAIRELERGRISQPRQSTVRQIAKALRQFAQDDDAFPDLTRGLRPAQLPAGVADFTGRDEQVKWLTGILTDAAASLSARTVVVVAVTGAGGVGKTAFTTHVAREAARCFPDGQLHLNLRGTSTQPMTAADGLARLLRDLGDEPAALPADEGERSARYRTVTARQRLLIVLDDAASAAQVRPLVPGGSGCAVVVTSRRSLHELESARQVELSALDEDDARALFLGIVGLARAADEPDAVRGVLTACGGLPLAIRIAGARLVARPAWPIAALASRLSDQRSRLDELETGDLAVRASFMVSYASVRADARRAAMRPDRAFRMLGLAQGSDIALAASGALLGEPLDRAEQLLEALVDAHLLESAAPGRYRLHDLLHVYAAERVRAEESVTARGDAIRRLLLWYLHTAAAACRLVNAHRPHLDLRLVEPGVTPLAFDNYADGLAWLDDEHANLLEAVNQAAEQGEHEMAWQLAHVLWDLFNLRGHIGNWLTAHNTGLASARVLGDPEAQARMLSSLAGNYLYEGRRTEALGCLQEILDIAHALGDTGRVAVASVNLGVTLTELGRATEAMVHLQDALALFRTMGERNGEAYALCGIGAVSGLRGDFDDAISGYQQGLTILKEIGNLASAGESLVELSNLRLKLGQLDIVLLEAKEAVGLCRKTGNRRGEAGGLAALGRAYRDRGQPMQARRCWQDAVRIYTEVGHPRAAELTADLNELRGRRVDPGLPGA
jgi:tetratricopeptide (TPR) repeat protein/transcriptional regulator with XRE-family HTH domain